MSYKVEFKYKEIFEKFDNIGCVTFGTIDNGYPEARIAHFLTYDDEGLYFMTMKSKPFYKQLKENGRVSACGMSAKTTQSSHDEDGMSQFAPGYTFRVSGDVKEISFEQLEEKASKNKSFIPCIKDIEKYNDMTTFCLYKGKGEIFDYDFEMKERENKIQRQKFTFGKKELPFRGVVINDKCIGCNKCFNNCTFKAISITEDKKCKIDTNKCDVCGTCVLGCPVNAIEVTK